MKYLAEKAQCYWLLDAIASWQGSRKLRNSRMQEGFQIWELRRVKGSEFVLLGSWDTDKIVIQQKIEYSDFPLDYIKLYYENQLLCLPDER